MTTASVLLAVSTTWVATSDKNDKEGKEGRIRYENHYISGVATRELRETASTREQSLRIMREWIQQNGDLKNIRTDESFLLRFLRQKKYSIPMAQQTLLKYLGLRKYYPESFTELDCKDVKMEEIVDNGYIMISPVRDSKSRRIIVYNIGKLDGNKFSCWDICRVHILIYETLLEDHVDQICGFTHVGDGTGLTGAHITSWNPIDFARLMKWGEQSLPMRHKEFHFINVPAAVKYIIDFATSKVTPKMAERLHVHSNLKQLHSNVDAACLPTVYGGKIPLQDMIQYTKKLLSDHRKTLLNLDNMEILSTKGIISSRSNNGVKENTVSIEGSFRKLEID